MEIRIASSFISYEQAERNLKSELAGSFDEVRAAAKKTWTEHLDRAKVEGGTDVQRKTFYSCMYRALLFPRTWHEIDASGKPVHKRIQRQAGAGSNVRGPRLLGCVSRLVSVDVGDVSGAARRDSASLGHAYREGGWMPRFLHRDIALV